MNQTAESLWFVFYKDELLLEKEGNGTFAIPCGEIPPILIKDKTTVHNITTLEGRNCKAYSVSQPIEETEQYAMMGFALLTNTFRWDIIRQQAKPTKYCIGTETVCSARLAALRWNKRNLS